MHPLHIALHDGFRGQHVRITVNGQIVFDRTDVRTDLRISQAAAVDTTAPARRVTLSAAIDPGGISGSTEVDVVATPFVSLDLLADGSLRWNPSAEPFRYL
jgi:hypothetical protein